MRALAITAALVAIALAAPMLGKGSAPAGSVSRAEVQRAVMTVFGKAGGPRAVKVARCESELDPTAVSDTDDHGVFQLNRPTWDPARNPRARRFWPKGKTWRDVYDAVVNAKVARAISRGGRDFHTAWRASASCWNH